ncbi:MAG: DUF4097 family beta strand repeat-containing protein [Gemmatimonadota bacterium]|nr:DUF4097 family beta strand repeat-containing protein [Gemmatimonadota bacterium]
MRDGADYVEKSQFSFPVEAGGTLTTDNAFASIKISSWAKDEVNVTVEKRSEIANEGRARRAIDDVEVRTEKRDDDVHINVEGPDSNRRNRVTVSITVRVPERYHLDLKASGGDIVIDDLRGDVRARSSGGDVVMGNIRESTVDVRTSGGDIRLESGEADTRMKTSGGDVRIENAGGRTEVQASGGDIQIEHADGDVDVRTSGGDFEIENTAGKLTASSSGGDIDIENATGRLSIGTSGGDIQIENAMDGVDAESGGGDIDIENARGTITVRTTGGDIQIENAQGGVTAKTSGGDINIQFAGDDSSTDRSSHLESTGGEVTVYLPDDLAATIDAEIKIDPSGFWRRRDYRIYSEFDLFGNAIDGGPTRTWAWVSGRLSARARVKGDLNGGGDEIRIETTHGNIKIKKR